MFVDVFCVSAIRRTHAFTVLVMEAAESGMLLADVAENVTATVFSVRNQIALRTRRVNIAAEQRVIHAKPAGQSSRYIVPE